MVGLAVVTFVPLAVTVDLLERVVGAQHWCSPMAFWR
jgi:hypothetical protein